MFKISYFTDKIFIKNSKIGGNPKNRRMISLRGLKTISNAKSRRGRNANEVQFCTELTTIFHVKSLIILHTAKYAIINPCVGL